MKKKKNRRSKRGFLKSPLGIGLAAAVLNYIYEEYIHECGCKVGGGSPSSAGLPAGGVVSQQGLTVRSANNILTV